MTYFFERRDPWGQGMALWVLLGLLFLIPPAIWSVQRIDLADNAENWLPASEPQAQMLEWYRGHFESDDPILISWNTSSLHDPRVAKLAARLNGSPDENGVRRHGLPQVSAVLTPHEIIERMTAQGIDRNTAVTSLQGLLVGRGTLKITLTEAGRKRAQTTIDALVAGAKERFSIDVSTVTPAQLVAAHAASTAANSSDTAAVGTDLTASTETATAEPVSTADERTVDVEVFWPGMQFDAKRVSDVRELALSLRGTVTTELPQGEPLVKECFFVPGSPVAITATLSEAGEADAAAALVAIRSAAVDVGIRPEELHMAGHAVTRAALNQEIRTAAWNRSFSIAQPHRRSVVLLSALMGILVAGIVLRNFKLAMFVLGVSAYTLLASVALVPATSGSMNMLLIVLPTLLWVVTISAAMHVANYWRHSASKSLRDAVVQATIMARRPSLWAGLATAVALLTLTTSPLAPVKEFGWYGALGCLISLILVLFGLPALLQFWPSALPTAIEADGTEWKWLGEQIIKRRRVVLAVSFVLFAGGMYGMRWFRPESRVIEYLPSDSRVAEDYRFFEEQVAGILPVEMIVRFDSDAQSRLNFLDRVELVRGIENEMRRLPHVSGALSLADFQMPVEALEENASIVQKARWNRQAAAAETAVKESAATTMKSLFVMADRDGQLSGNSPVQLCNTGDELWRITAHVATLSDFNYGDLTRDLDAIAQSSLKRHAGAGHIVTGTVPHLLRTQQAVLQSLIKSSLITFIVIGLVMTFLLRSPVAGMLSLLPTVLPIGMVLGVVCWFGYSVDIGTMVTASVALGVAVHGTLHLLTWFRNGIEEGLPRHEACLQAMTQCGPVMWQSTAVVSLGMLMLVSADLVLVSRFGLIMAALVGSTLAAGVALFPLLLDGVLGRLIESSLQPVRTPGTIPPRPIRPSEPQPVKSPTTVPALQPHLKVVAPTSMKQGRKLRID